MSGQQGYKHHFLRKLLVTNGRGIAFQTLGDDAKLTTYTESASEDAKKEESSFNRSIAVSDAKGVEWKATGKKGGTFNYHEEIEFTK